MPYSNAEVKKEYDRKWWREHKGYRDRHNREVREKKRVVVLEYLKRHPCVDCGESDPVVLEFDHVRGEKKAGISKMLTNKVPLKTLLAEIAKCEVRCANCHRRKTYREWHAGA